MLSRIKSFLVLCLAAFFVSAVYSQNEERPVRVTTDLVTITLTVTDPYGRYVSGLKKHAFTIYDEGEEQEISFFSNADAPVSIGILFDISGSMSGEKIQRARKALERFVSISHPMDEYFLIAFNSRAQLLLDRTRDSDALLRKLTLVRPKDNTALYDAVYLGVEKVTRGAHQRKAILIISDGQDNSSRYTFKEVKNLLKESDVTIYAVGIMDSNDMRDVIGLQGQAFLDELAAVSGGKSFYPKTNVELDEIFERIAIELRNQYSVGYIPKNFKPDGKWRRIKVKVKPPKGMPRLIVRTREGYYATPTIK
ncbi:MAG: VWA domain-containing protein [Pyrinomonadaceae bacterium]|nr:VWA domain-containing protein [Pyrinomonadaceae bacterium]MCX7639415.1 VWA domain-containing protein [Pyrinomonadaceae bacterium]MDW8304535.1 VWA domain-containing protein [Acidobacteriota bacterium]